MKERPLKKYPNRPHAYRGISLEQLMGLKRPPKVVPLYEYKCAKGEIEVMSRGLTMVLSREVNANAKIAADIAVAVAQRNPERPVWYVNTFAGVDMMQQTMEEARRSASLPELVPQSLPDEAVLHARAVDESDRIWDPNGLWRDAEYDVRDEVDHKRQRRLEFGPEALRPWEQWVRDGHRYFHVGDHANDQDQENYMRARRFVAAARADVEQRKAQGLLPKSDVPAAGSVLPNLHYFEIPAGQWDVEALAAALRGSETEGAETEQKQSVSDNAAVRPIVIVNSFDYSPLSRCGKWRMSRELLELMDAFEMSLVVFTQEMRLEFGAGIAGRGSVGLLCGRAERVARMTDEFEHLIRSRKRQNQADKANVHEAQMLAPVRGNHVVTIKSPDGSEEKLQMYGTAEGVRRYVVDNLLE
jgi:hypothetical protein